MEFLYLLESSHQADFENDQYWFGRCKKHVLWQVLQKKWTNLADSMIKRFQAYRDYMGGPNEN